MTSESEVSEPNEVEYIEEESPVVYISYERESAAHKERVLALANKLMGDGIEVRIDLYPPSPPEGWPKWRARQLEDSDFVLVVCTAAYCRLFEGGRPVGEDRSAAQDAHLIRQIQLDAGGLNDKFLPVLFDGDGGYELIPRLLRGVPRYSIKSQYEDLYRRLTNQPDVVKPEKGRLKKLPPRQIPTLEELSGDGASHRASRVDPQRRDAALHSIVRVLDANDDLPSALAKGSDTWLQAAAASRAALASEILASESPAVLVRTVRVAMMRLRSHRNAPALADGMVRVLEHALPIVGGACLIVEHDGRGRWRTNASYVSTVESPMATFDGRPCEGPVGRASDDSDRLPDPPVAIDITNIPRAGARDGARVADVATALEHRFDDLTLDALEGLAEASNRAGGGLQFPNRGNLDDRLEMANEAIADVYNDEDPPAKVTVYALADPAKDHDHEHSFIQLLREKLPSLAVLVPMSSVDRSLNNSLRSALGQLHGTYRSIIKGVSL